MRTDRIRDAAKANFLEAMGRLGTITAASRETGVPRSDHYFWMQDPEYVKAFREAEDIAIDAMEAEARRRAVQGTNRPVYQAGRQVGDVTEYSDQLLIVLLKAHRPEKYRERVELTVNDMRKLVEARAAAEGLDPAEVWAELESILPGAQ